MILSESEYTNEIMKIVNRNDITQDMCDYVLYVLKWENPSFNTEQILKKTNNRLKDFILDKNYFIKDFLCNVSEFIYLLDALLFICTNNEGYGTTPYDELSMVHNNKYDDPSINDIIDGLNNLVDTEFIKITNKFIFDPNKSKIPFRIEGGYIDQYFQYDDLNMDTRKKLYHICIDKFTNTIFSEEYLNEKNLICKILKELLKIDPFYIMILNNIEKDNKIKKYINNRAFIINYLIIENPDFLKFLNLYFNWEKIESEEYTKNSNLLTDNIKILKYEFELLN